MLGNKYDGLLNVPWTIMFAIEHALMINSWDNLPEDEKPPKEIWSDDEKLEKYFKDIKKQKNTGNKKYDYKYTVE